MSALRRGCHSAAAGRRLSGTIGPDTNRYFGRLRKHQRNWRNVLETQRPFLIFISAHLAHWAGWPLGAVPLWRLPFRHARRRLQPSHAHLDAHGLLLDARRRWLELVRFQPPAVGQPLCPAHQPGHDLWLPGRPVPGFGFARTQSRVDGYRVLRRLPRLLHPGHRRVRQPLQAERPGRPLGDAARSGG
jgi:hypothetical protein